MKDVRTGLLLTAAFVAALAMTGVSRASLKLTPSDRCGDCHRDIYRMWRDSSHASPSPTPRNTADSTGTPLA